MAIVERAPGDKPGDTIEDPILVSEAAKIHRGTQEINYHSTDRILKTGSVVNTDFILPGSLVDVQDKTGTHPCMVTDFSLQTRSGVKSIDISTNVVTEGIK